MTVSELQTVLHEIIAEDFPQLVRAKPFAVR